MTDETVDTGIETTATETQQVDAFRALLQMPNDLTPVKLTQIARDVAQNFYSLPDILFKYGLSVAQYEFLEKYNEFFKHILADQAKAWQGITATEDRVRLQTLLALEEQLPTIAGRMGRHTEDLRDVVEAAKLFADISGLKNTAKGNSTPGERFTIHIDLGADAKTEITVGTPPMIDVTPDKGDVK